MSSATGFAGRFLGALISASVLVGCDASTGISARSPLPEGSCPTRGAARDSRTIIDWVPFVVVGDVMFRSVYTAESVLADKDIGPVVATVKCRIEGIVDDPEFRPRDGDAAYLAVGTELRTVVGAPATTGLAVQEDGVWRLYEATDPAPPRGADAGKPS